MPSQKPPATDVCSVDLIMTEYQDGEVYIDVVTPTERLLPVAWEDVLVKEIDYNNNEKARRRTASDEEEKLELLQERVYEGCREIEELWDVHYDLGLGNGVLQVLNMTVAERAMREFRNSVRPIQLDHKQTFAYHKETGINPFRDEDTPSTPSSTGHFLSGEFTTKERKDRNREQLKRQIEDLVSNVVTDACLIQSESEEKLARPLVDAEVLSFIERERQKDILIDTLRGQLIRRNRSLAEQRTAYMRELLVLKNQLSRRKDLGEEPAQWGQFWKYDLGSLEEATREEAPASTTPSHVIMKMQAQFDAEKEEMQMRFDDEMALVNDQLLSQQFLREAQDKDFQLKMKEMKSETEKKLLTTKTLFEEEKKAIQITMEETLRKNKERYKDIKRRSGEESASRIRTLTQREEYLKDSIETLKAQHRRELSARETEVKAKSIAIEELKQRLISASSTNKERTDAGYVQMRLIERENERNEEFKFMSASLLESRNEVLNQRTRLETSAMMFEELSVKYLTLLENFKKSEQSLKDAQQLGVVASSMRVQEKEKKSLMTEISSIQKELLKRRNSINKGNRKPEDDEALSRRLKIAEKLLGQKIVQMENNSVEFLDLLHRFEEFEAELDMVEKDAKTAGAVEELLKSSYKTGPVDITNASVAKIKGSLARRNSSKDVTEDVKKKASAGLKKTQSKPALFPGRAASSSSQPNLNHNLEPSRPIAIEKIRAERLDAPEGRLRAGSSPPAVNYFDTSVGTRGHRSMSRHLQLPNPEVFGGNSLDEVPSPRTISTEEDTSSKGDTSQYLPEREDQSTPSTITIHLPSNSSEVPDDTAPSGVTISPSHSTLLAIPQEQAGRRSRSVSLRIPEDIEVMGQPSPRLSPRRIDPALEEMKREGASTKRALEDANRQIDYLLSENERLRRLTVTMAQNPAEETPTREKRTSKAPVPYLGLSIVSRTDDKGKVLMSPRQQLASLNQPSPTSNPPSPTSNPPEEQDPRSLTPELMAALASRSQKVNTSKPNALGNEDWISQLSVWERLQIRARILSHKLRHTIGNINQKRREDIERTLRDTALLQSDDVAQRETEDYDSYMYIGTNPSITRTRVVTANFQPHAPSSVTVKEFEESLPISQGFNQNSFFPLPRDINLEPSPRKTHGPSPPQTAKTNNLTSTSLPQSRLGTTMLSTGVKQKVKFPAPPSNIETSPTIKPTHAVKIPSSLRKNDVTS
ncbi:hypothetical protein PROFUN_05802 [Planoprotostelium fungivorum]|uniref:Uncharacterized protein n=1 Tax=Planoprotostelium fungivorum TaxID=1890364 RepID=A0A2P6NPZ2_9EUKA|nr:hypothetical protein PROFUN_05802 [Planoprotostelium fungivorum]